jgi:hypothetical protein
MTTEPDTNEATLTMSSKERERLKIIGRVVKREMSCVEAAESLGLTERQLYRIRDRYIADGDEGLIHRLRGSTSNYGYGFKVRTRLLDLYRERYSDYGPTLFGEMIEEHHSLMVANIPDHETIRRWLLKAGLWTMERKSRAHRRKRERRGSIGSLVQFDGSEHEWFEKRGPKCCLLVAVDDASSTVLARFAASEDTRNVLLTLRAYIEHYGIPRESYMDRAKVYKNQKGTTPTDVERALGRLGVTMITAYSPQAKGRVERCNRTLQDRLVKALRRNGISTIEAANRYLEQTYLPDHNKRFALTRGLKNIHRSSSGLDLDNIFCFETTRKVNNDYTITLGATLFQLDASREVSRPVPGSTVTIRRWLNDDEIRIFWNEQPVRFSQIKSRPKPEAPILRRPAVDHPWRNLKPVGRRRYNSRRAEKRKGNTPGRKVLSSTPAPS